MTLDHRSRSLNVIVVNQNLRIISLWDQKVRYYVHDHVIWQTSFQQCMFHSDEIIKLNTCIQSLSINLKDYEWSIVTLNKKTKYLFLLSTQQTHLGSVLYIMILNHVPFARLGNSLLLVLYYKPECLYFEVKFDNSKISTIVSKSTFTW